MRTQQKATHTPTPWKLKTEDHLDGASLYSNEVYITSLEGDNNPHQQKLGFLPVDEQKANAAFIVRAVNSFEALLKACKKASFVMETMASRFPETVELLDKAIAQAEGRPTDTEIHDYITENPPEARP